MAVRVCTLIDIHTPYGSGRFRELQVFRIIMEGLLPLYEVIEGLHQSNIRSSPEKGEMQCCFLCHHQPLPLRRYVLPFLFDEISRE